MDNDGGVGAYIDAIPVVHRALFDRVHDLVVTAFPDAGLGLSYRMPTFSRGKKKLYVGAWAHGISLYGWKAGQDAGFLERHPALRSGRGTVRIRPADADVISDSEILDLVRSALGG